MQAAGIAPTVAAAGRHRADQVTRLDRSPLEHLRLDRLIGGAQAARMAHGDHRLAGDLPGHRDRAGRHREHRVASAGGEVDAAMAGLPGRGRRVEAGQDEGLGHRPGAAAEGHPPDQGRGEG